MDDDGDNCLDILGQQPALYTYTRLSLIYPVPDPPPRGDIVDTLTTGLGRLAENLPWVAGRANKGNSCHGGLSSVQIVPFGSAPSLTVRDPRQDESAPTMSSLRGARFPFRNARRGRHSAPINPFRGRAQDPCLRCRRTSSTVA